MMTTVTFGIMTPPVGVALYSTSEIMGCTPSETVKAAIPFYCTIIALVLILTCISRNCHVPAKLGIWQVKELSACNVCNMKYIGDYYVEE